MSFSLEMLLAIMVFLLIVFLILYLDKKIYFTNKDLLEKDIERKIKIESEVTRRTFSEVEKQLKELKEELTKINQALKEKSEQNEGEKSKTDSGSPEVQNKGTALAAPTGNNLLPADIKREVCVYVPSMKIWGIGLIVGLLILITPILCKIIESLFIRQPEYRTDLYLRWPVWPYVVQIFGLLFIFGIFAFVIAAIIKIAKED